MSEAQGGCLCGAVRYALARLPQDAAFCHCRACQKATGAPVVLWASAPRKELRLLKGTPGVFASSPMARRHFCAECGAALFMEHERWPEHVDVAVATLDDPDRIAPLAHIYAGSRRTCMASLARNLPDHEGEPDNLSGLA